jgi:Fur family ferric uptake transcriptional regulator
MMAAMVDDPAAVLRRVGLKVTVQRLAVLRAVSGRPHVTADDVFEAVRDDIGSISRQAVYDALGMLVDKGLVRRIQPAGSAARFEGRVGDNHHHLICRSCGRVVDVDCAVGSTPCLIAADDRGFEIDEAEVVYWGRCPDCVAAGPSSDGEAAETTSGGVAAGTTSDGMAAGTTFGGVAAGTTSDGMAAGTTFGGVAANTTPTWTKERDSRVRE